MSTLSTIGAVAAVVAYCAFWLTIFLAAILFVVVLYQAHVALNYYIAEQNSRARQRHFEEHP